MTTKFSWNEESTQTLIGAVSGLVTQDQLKELAEELGTTPRSVGAKLRSLVKDGVIEVEVQKASEAAKSTWTADEEEALVEFVNVNEGAMTYAEIAASFAGGKFNAKQVQGKVLSLKMTDMVKKAAKPESKRSYSEAEEAKYIEMAEAGATLEAIAAEIGKPLKSIRGKGLSLQKEGRIAEIPHQETSTAQARPDLLEGVDVAEMTVAEIAEAIGRSERGVKNLLSRRGLTCQDHDGAAKRAKLDEKKNAE